MIEMILNKDGFHTPRYLCDVCLEPLGPDDVILFVMADFRRVSSEEVMELPYHMADARLAHRGTCQTELEKLMGYSRVDGPQLVAWNSIASHLDQLKQNLIIPQND